MKDESSSSGQVQWHRFLRVKHRGAGNFIHRKNLVQSHQQQGIIQHFCVKKIRIIPVLVKQRDL